MRVGLFGGTFDPPHLGHMILAAEAYHQLDLDQLLFILTPSPPHKVDQKITPIADRLMMLETALDGYAEFELSQVELNRPGPHYAVDTLNALQAQHPTADLIYLMGGDSVMELPNWERASEFVTQCEEIGVMKRSETVIDSAELDAQLPGVSEKIKMVNAPLLEIASRQIRRRVTEGRPYQFFVLPAVANMINERQMYQDSE